MKTRGVIGQRIVRIEQVRRLSNAGWVYSVEGIWLENGTVLRPITGEWESDGYLVEITAWSPRARAKARGEKR